jgi:hypothetical protein
MLSMDLGGCKYFGCYGAVLDLDILRCWISHTGGWHLIYGQIASSFHDVHSI